MASIQMYLTEWCPYCKRAEALLRAKGVQAIDRIDVEAQPERRQEMIQRAGKTSVPQIFIDGRHVGGCDDLHALDRAGGLDPLLAA